MPPSARRTALLAAGALCSLLTPARAAVSDPFPGVRLVRDGGKALAVVNLCAPGVSMRATRAGERVKTAKSWGEAVGAQLAINGDFYDIGGTNATWGRARGAGEDWPGNLQFQQAKNGEHRQWVAFGPGYAHLEFDSFVEPPSPQAATEIVGGHIVLIQNGQKIEPIGDILAESVTPRQRTALGFSEDHKTVFLFTTHDVMNGNGMVASMVAMAAEAGAPALWEATSLDGGGSTQMYVQGQGAILPSTRQVSNHWGVLAKGSGPSPHCVDQTPPYRATFVEQSWPLAAEPPLVLSLGETRTGHIALKNTGKNVWKSGVVKLATAPRDTSSPFHADSWSSSGRVSVVDHDVPPGESYTFPCDLKGNQLGAPTPQFFGVVAEGVTWFSDPGQGGPPDDLLQVRVEVVQPPPAGTGGAGGKAGAAGAPAAGQAGNAGNAGGKPGAAGKGGAGGASGSSGQKNSSGGSAGSQAGQSAAGRGGTSGGQATVQASDSEQEGSCALSVGVSARGWPMLSALAALVAWRRRRSSSSSASPRAEPAPGWPDVPQSKCTPASSIRPTVR